MKIKLFFVSLSLISCLFVILFFTLSPNMTNDTEIRNNDTHQNNSSQEQQIKTTASEKSLKNSISKKNKRVVQDSDAIRKETNSSINSTLNKTNYEEALNKATDKNSEEALDDDKLAIPVNFTFLSGIDNKALTNYPVELRCKFNEEPEITEKFITDENGKFTFLAPKNSGAFFTFITADYTILKEHYRVHYNENFYNVKLFKGGRLEVKVKTTDQKKVDKLMFFSDFSDFSVNGRKIFEMTFDPTRNLFYSTNLTIGIFELYFKAPHYEKTAIYRTTISSKETAQLEIQLNPAREILFQLSSELPTTRSIFVVPMTSEVKFPGFKPKTEILLNEENQYPYELPTQEVEGVMVYVKDYLPQPIILEPNKDLYFVPLEEGYQAEILVTDESDVPLSNATILYALDNTLERYTLKAEQDMDHLDELSVMSSKLTLTTNQEGIATLKGLAKKERIFFSVSYPNYKKTYSSLAFDAISNNTLHITISPSYSLSGKITFQSQPIADAVVFIEHWQSRLPIVQTRSAKDGSYTLTDLHQRDPKEIFIVTAFHKDYGVAEIPLTSLNQNQKQGQINLELKEEAVATLHLVDEDGKALPFKNILINNDYKLDFSMSVFTDKDGNYELKNVPRSKYYIKLNEEFYHIENYIIRIHDNEQHTLVAKKMDMIPIHISRTDEFEFKGLLKVRLLNAFDDWPLEVLLDEKGVHYIDELWLAIRPKATLIFEAEGFTPIQKGPFYNESGVPKEITLEFDVGASFKATVWDNETGHFLPGVTVEIFLDEIKVQALPTNENGQVFFSHLPKNFHLRIKHPNYAISDSSFATEVQKEAEIRLVHGGTLKGHYTLEENAKDALAILEPNKIQQPFDEEGYFEFHHLQPGEYSLYIQYNTLDDEIKTKKFSTKITIENKKIIEIDFDKAQEE